MSARNIVPIDLQRIEHLQQTSLAMLITMHSALSEITKCHVALDGGVTMRYIAEQSLSRVQEIAQTLEVANA